jgi:4-hydroxy-2-oxoheptanedioate aldolase
MIEAGLDIDGFLKGNPDPRFFEAMGKFSAAAAKNGIPVFGYGYFFPLTASLCISLTSNRGVLGLDQVPMAIESGMRAIAVQFDVWGFTRLVADSLDQSWKHAKTFEGNPKPSMSEGSAKPE